MSLEANFTIQAAVLAGVPVMAKMGTDVSKLDRNTQVKALGKDGYDLHAMGLEVFKDYIMSPKCRFIKAVNDSTGEIMGYCCWGLRGFNEGEFPPLPHPDNIVLQQTTEDAEERIFYELEELDPAKRLEKITADHMTHMMKKLMSEGAKYMFIVAFTVAGDWQSQGVGSALLQAGFEVIETLEVDLDGYATAPPPKELEASEGKWGHYVFRYMKQVALSAATETQ
ncbi:hypothetical protein M422DRAFT_241934 [Sphaerobolus stellatus SS14]|nr:hypothetical protein M422DRAFT_241934 [Sphaerobolus stellatus SS14]